MPTDYKLVETQLKKLGYTDNNETGSEVRAAVLELFHVLDAQPLDAVDRKTVAQVFRGLVETNLELAVDRAEWRQFYLGDVRIGEVVRVKPDAYPTKSGKKHNGLVGKLVGANHGRCIVQYTSRNDGAGHNHPPDLLEVLVK